MIGRRTLNLHSRVQRGRRPGPGGRASLSIPAAPLLLGSAGSAGSEADHHPRSEPPSSSPSLRAHSDGVLAPRLHPKGGSWPLLLSTLQPHSQSRLAATPAWNPAATFSTNAHSLPDPGQCSHSRPQAQPEDLMKPLPTDPATHLAPTPSLRVPGGWGVPSSHSEAGGRRGTGGREMRA